jgi:hypothetical protein
VRADVLSDAPPAADGALPAAPPVVRAPLATEVKAIGGGAYKLSVPGVCAVCAGRRATWRASEQCGACHGRGLLVGRLRIATYIDGLLIESREMRIVPPKGGLTGL